MKGGACWLAARATGIQNREALRIGVLSDALDRLQASVINVDL